MRTQVENLGFAHNYIASQNLQKPVTLLLLHGTGGDEFDMLPMGRALDPNANYLSPRGKVLEGGLPRFFRRLSEGVFDLVDLKVRTQELAEFTERAADAYGFDLDKIVAVGYSNGANIAASLLLLVPRLLAGAILFRPMVPIVPDYPPDLSLVSVLISAGLQDPVVPRDQPKALSDLLCQCGARTSLRWQEAGHVISTVEIEMAKEWLQAMLGDQWGQPS
jgi:phospholipase/carboxylesterase